MQQEDYLLREIQKIGLLLQALLNKLVMKREKGGPGSEELIGETKGQLLEESGFDVDKFLILNELESYQYLSGLSGYDPGNLEALAGILEQFGIAASAANRSLYLGKALLLLEYCNLSDRTFSFGREERIGVLKNRLKNDRGE